MQINKLTQWGNQQLLGASSSPLLDSEVLMSYLLKKPTSFLMTHCDHKLGLLSVLKYKRLIKKRKSGVPIAYLLNSKEFYFLDFYVDERVLVPRPDTEILVEEVIKYLNSQSDIPNFQLIDVGTGSGCIPISVIKNTSIEAVAIDVSRKALKVAKKNAKKHKVADRIQLIRSNLLEKLPYLSGKKIILTANLPYLPDDYKKTNPSLVFEPNKALYADRNGLDLYLKLIDQLPKIKPAALFFECFDWQVSLLQEKLKDYKVSTKKMTGNAVCLVVLPK